MKIKIATWNMSYWQHKKLHAEAWDYFVNTINADIFLFQEGRPTESILYNNDRLVWEEIGGKRDWGSGVYSKHILTKEMVKTQLNGVFSIATTNINNKEITAISLYGLFEKINGKSQVTPNNHRILSDLSSILKEGVVKKRNIIMGGDLNESLQFDIKQGNKDSENLFNRIESLGLLNCYKPFYKDFVQTLRHSRSTVKWQNDYLFISKHLSQNLSRCEVLDNEKIRKYSDHNIVVIEIEL
jgi:exodeoxyribonuclease-3